MAFSQAWQDAIVADEVGDQVSSGPREPAGVNAAPQTRTGRPGSS